MRATLWPESRHDHRVEIEAYFAEPDDSVHCSVAEGPDGGLVAFAEVGLRAYAQKCSSSPVGYIEGIFVVPGHRRSGVGEALVRAGEEWARGRGCSEMASDRQLENEPSGAFHEAIGYQEAERIVCYTKSLEAT